MANNTVLYKIIKGTRKVYDILESKLPTRQIDELKLSPIDGYGIFSIEGCKVRISYPPVQNGIKITGAPDQREKAVSLLEKTTGITLGVEK
jgi:hypothetical protein